MPTTRNPPRSTFWTLQLYPDCQEHADIVELLKREFSNDFIGILHDKDVCNDGYKQEHPDTKYEYGELIKPHWHILYRTNSRCGVDKVSALFGVPTHMIEPVHSVATYAQYLLHKDFATRLKGYKHEYSPSELFGNLDTTANKYDNQEIWNEVFRMIEAKIPRKYIVASLIQRGWTDFARKNLMLIKELTFNNENC